MTGEGGYRRGGRLAHIACKCKRIQLIENIYRKATTAAVERCRGGSYTEAKWIVAK